MNRRQGYSLFEALVGLSTGSVVLTLAALGVHRAMQWQSVEDAAYRDAASVWRLSQDLRRDLRYASAVDIEAAPEATRLLLTNEGASVATYRFDAAGAGRESDASREAYSFSRPVAWKVKRLSRGAGVLVEFESDAGPGLTLEGRAVLAEEGMP